MRRAARLAAKLTLALSILLNGLNPVMAGSTHMAAMPGMIMDRMDMGSSHGTPAKQMPCGGMDCGSCIGCVCAMPLTVQAAQDIRAGRPSSQANHSVAFLSGISFPPDIRPPISRAATA
jgi:uncharacterized protein involved in copper resistance